MNNFNFWDKLLQHLSKDLNTLKVLEKQKLIKMLTTLTQEQKKESFYTNLHTLLIDNEKIISKPLNIIESNTLNALDILRTLPYHTQANEKIIYNIWVKLEGINEYIKRIKNCAQEIPQKAIRFPLISSQIERMEQKEIYEAFQHDAQNSLFLIAGYGNSLLNRVLEVLPESKEKANLESSIKKIVDLTNLIETKTQKNSLKRYLQ